jgi:hypothetical protein
MSVAVPSRVVGSATIAENETSAVVTWSYRKAGKSVRTTVPPKMRIGRIASSTPFLMVKLPTLAFGMKIGTDMQRSFDEPVVLDSDQEVTCSCRMRDDCGKGDSFQCEIEAELVQD